MDGTVKEVQKTGPLGKHLHPVFFLRQMVVDILKLHGFCVVALFYPANTIREHSLEGNGILCRLWHPIISSGQLYQASYLASFLSV